MPQYITTRKQLTEFLETETKYYSNKLLRLIPYNYTESQILLKHIILLRKTEYYSNTKRKIHAYFYKFRLRRLQNKYCLHIPINVFDKGLRIMHVGPILVNGNATVGKNCSLHINTGIVAGGIAGVPTLGDNIVVGFGSCVLGGIHLADGIAIGANAVVNKSFEESNIAIAGVPAKKISNNGTATWNKAGNNQNQPE